MIADSWVVLKADDKTVWDDDMIQGQRKTFEANEQFKFLTIGNAAGIHLTLNDVKLPALGAEGEVIHDRVLDRDLLQKLRAPQTNP